MAPWTLLRGREESVYDGNINDIFPLNYVKTKGKLNHIQSIFVFLQLS